MNPFANYGRIVHGDRFIGRETIMNNIENRIIHPDNPGNLVIIGMHRIGKSSLAHKAIIEQKDNLTQKRGSTYLDGGCFIRSAIRFFSMHL